MKLTMMEAKGLLACEGGAVLWSGDLAAVMEGLDGRCGVGRAERPLLSFDVKTRACVPTGEGIRAAKERIRGEARGKREEVTGSRGADGIETGRREG